jgi:hypothetical protein
MNEEYGEGLVSKITDSWHNEIWDASKYHYFTFLNPTQQRLFLDGNAR